MGVLKVLPSLALVKMQNRLTNSLSKMNAAGYVFGTADSVLWAKIQSLILAITASF